MILVDLYYNWNNGEKYYRIQHLKIKNQQYLIDTKKMI